MKIHPASKKKFGNELPDEVPNEMLNQDWAMKIHSQTLERLNERGGLTVLEILINIKKIGWPNRSDTKEDVIELKKLIAQYLSKM
jgi:hypothetical protein